MNHEFISLKRNDIPEVTTYGLRGGKDAIVVDDVLIILIMVIISQCIHILKHP